jgi:hypothetical protein
MWGDKMTQDETKKPSGKYWICDVCALKKNWERTDRVVTVIKGICGHCAMPVVQMLTPIVDFNKPNGEKAVWD